MEIPFYMKVRKSECSNRYHLHTIVLQINCRRWPLRGEKPKVQPSSRAEKPKKVQNVFIFWSPESTEKREKPNRWKFLLYEGSQKRVHKQTTFLVFGSEHPVMNIRRRLGSSFAA
jgi:hypothetical protein